MEVTDFFSRPLLIEILVWRLFWTIISISIEEGHRWRIVWKCGCRSTHFAVVHPQNLMQHPWQTTNTVSEVRHGCFINVCGCTTAKRVLRHRHFHTILHLWGRLKPINFNALIILFWIWDNTYVMYHKIMRYFNASGDFPVKVCVRIEGCRSCKMVRTKVGLF